MDILTPTQAADELHVHVQTLIAEIHREKLRASRVGTQFRIRREDLEAYLDSTATLPAVAADETAAEFEGLAQVPGPSALVRTEYEETP